MAALAPPGTVRFIDAVGKAYRQCKRKLPSDVQCATYDFLHEICCLLLPAPHRRHAAYIREARHNIPVLFKMLRQLAARDAAAFGGDPSGHVVAAREAGGGCDPGLPAEGAPVVPSASGLPTAEGQPVAGAESSDSYLQVDDDTNGIAQPSGLHLQVDDDSNGTVLMDKCVRCDDRPEVREFVAGPTVSDDRLPAPCSHPGLLDAPCLFPAGGWLDCGLFKNNEPQGNEDFSRAHECIFEVRQACRACVNETSIAIFRYMGCSAEDSDEVCARGKFVRLQFDMGVENCPLPDKHSDEDLMSFVHGEHVQVDELVRDCCSPKIQPLLDRMKVHEQAIGDIQNLYNGMARKLRMPREGLHIRRMTRAMRWSA
mmetsp:Transcript_49725/g.153573  ORF Transcript_49725/g.153573 Transcript_49725/m.153573 type:complete len:370 (-) Transcript_49725:264-1373(-)